MKNQISLKRIKIPNSFTILYFFFGIICVMVLGYSFLNATDLCRGDVLSKFLLNNSVDEKNQDTLNKFLSAKTLKLGNILDDDEILKSDMFKKVFLIESHMNEMRVLDNARQACSVESAG